MNDIRPMAISIDDDNTSISDLVLVGDELPNTNDLLDMLTMSSTPVQLEVLDSTCSQDFVTIPMVHYGPPKRTTYEGNFKFVVEVSSKDTHKKKFLYSDILNRIYVNMNDNFPMQFNWDGNGCGANMFVRATVVFSDEAEAEKRVERCVQHLHERRAADDTSDRQSIVRHVLQSSREVNTPGVAYHGDPNVPNSWYSVLVELNKPCHEPCTHAYKFVCKTSCSSGINRRATSIIFTLENAIGEVYGRQIVGVRVCACPRRDMVKDEQGVDKSKPGKRRLAAQPSEHTLKRVKTEAPAADDPLLVLPQLPVTDMRTMVTGLEVMVRMMEQGAEQTNDPQKANSYTQCIDAFKRFLHSNSTN